MSFLTIVFAVAFFFTLALLIRSLFRQAGIQDTVKEASDQAAGQLKLWEELGEHLDEGVALLNEHGDIEYANQSFATMTGWVNRSAFHQSLDQVLQLQDENAQEPKQPLGEQKQKRFVLARDGNRTMVAASKRSLQKPTGYAVVILQDATAEEAEKELRHRLVNLSSFELRAPITAMKGFSAMLIDGDAGKLPKEAFEYIKQILDGSNRLLSIIDDMARVEELSNSKPKIHQEPMDVYSYIEGIVPKLEEVAKTAEHSFQLASPHVVAQVSIDPAEITRLLTMLVNTAARSGKAGTTVSLEMVESPQTIELHITNQGDKLPRQNQANVFDYVGAQGFDEGIGFYVAKQIIEAHHAYVTVSTVPDGNLFILSLPKLPAGTKAAVTPASSATPQPLKPKQPDKIGQDKSPRRKLDGNPPKHIGGDVSSKKN